MDNMDDIEMDSIRVHYPSEKEIFHLTNAKNMQNQHRWAEILDLKRLNVLKKKEARFRKQYTDLLLDFKLKEGTLKKRFYKELDVLRRTLYKKFNRSAEIWISMTQHNLDDLPNNIHKCDCGKCPTDPAPANYFSCVCTKCKIDLGTHRDFQITMCEYMIKCGNKLYTYIKSQRREREQIEREIKCIKNHQEKVAENQKTRDEEWKLMRHTLRQEGYQPEIEVLSSSSEDNDEEDDSYKKNVFKEIMRMRREPDKPRSSIGVYKKALSMIHTRDVSIY